MGNFFPYEVVPLSVQEAQEDKGLLRIKIEKKPDWLDVFVDETLLSDLSDPMIIDYTELNEIQFPFVVMNPQFSSDYHFYFDLKLE